MSFDTETKLCGLPLFSFGQGAKGFFAIGQFATGVFVLAQFGAGFLVVGQFGLGVITVNQFGIGFFLLAMGGVGAVFALGGGVAGFISNGAAFYQLRWGSREEVKTFKGAVQIVVNEILADPFPLTMWLVLWIAISYFVIKKRLLSTIFNSDPLF